MSPVSQSTNRGKTNAGRGFPSCRAVMNTVIKPRMMAIPPRRGMGAVWILSGPDESNSCDRAASARMRGKLTAQTPKAAANVAQNLISMSAILPGTAPFFFLVWRARLKGNRGDRIACGLTRQLMDKAADMPHSQPAELIGDSSHSRAAICNQCIPDLAPDQVLSHVLVKDLPI
jgi:hypothetical protein